MVEEGRALNMETGDYVILGDMHWDGVLVNLG